MADLEGFRGLGFRAFRRFRVYALPGNNIEPKNDPTKTTRPVTEGYMKFHISFGEGRGLYRVWGIIGQRADGSEVKDVQG